MVRAKLPDGIASHNLIGGGTSGVIALHPKPLAIKFPHDTFEGDDGAVSRCNAEAEAYEKLRCSDRPSSLLGYFGRYEDSEIKGIWLEYAPKGSVTHFLKASIPSRELRMRWSLQAVEALEFCHRYGVLHGDICANNFLLDESLNLKLADFTAASDIGSRSVGCYGPSHLWPGDTEEERRDPWNIPMDTRTEIFALGSALFEIWTGHVPLHDLDDEKKIAAFRAQDLPLVDCAIQGIIHSCWRNEYKSMSQLLHKIRPLAQTFIREAKDGPTPSLMRLSAFTENLINVHLVSALPIVCLAGSLALYYRWRAHLH